MAKDVITRFKLETTGFDSKIKQAAKDLSAYSKTATQAKEGFDKFTKSNIDAAKDLGTMATSTTNVKDRAKELVGAFNDAAKAYNSLTKEQQQSDWAKALAGSLTQLQQRIKETKQEMQGLGDSMKGGGGLFSGIGSKMEGALAVFGGNMMTKGAGMLAGLASEMGDMVKQGIELAKQGEGIRIAFERLGRGDILDGLREATHGTVTDLELMKAAVKFNDFKLSIEELGTMLAFAQQKAKDTGQSVDYMVDSIVTGLGRKSLMILDNLGLSAAEIKEKMAETGDMTKAVGEIIREQMSKAGDYVETAADRAAQANVNLQNKMEELGRKFQPLSEASTSFWTTMKVEILDVVGGPLTRLLNGLTSAGRLMNKMNDIGGGNSQSETDKQLRFLRNTPVGKRQARYQKQIEIYNEKENEAWRKFNQARNEEAEFQRDARKRGARESDLNKYTEFDRRQREAKLEAQAWHQFRINYQKRAQAILNPPSSGDNAFDHEIQTVDTLKKKLNELQAQRKKAIKAGDQDLAKNLTKQITQIKSDIKALDPKALTTTHTLTKPEQADAKYVQAQKDYEQSLQQAALEVKAGTINSAEAKKKELQAAETLWKSIGDAREVYDSPKLKEAQEKVEGKIIELGPQVEASITAQKAAEQSARELEQAAKKLAEAERKRSEQYANWHSNSTSGIANYISYQQGLLGQQPIGSGDYAQIASNLADANTYKNLMQVAIQNGMNDIVVDASSLWQKIIGEADIQDATWKELQDKINNKLKELGVDPIKINFATGNEAKQTTEKHENQIGKVVSGMTSITNSLQHIGVEIPEGFNKVINIMNIIQTIMTTVGSLGSAGSFLSNIPLIGGFFSLFGLANGGVVHAANGFSGIVPGNLMSGDQIPALLNSGEVVLNRAQAGVLASDMRQGSIGYEGRTQAVIESDQIKLVLRNGAQARGMTLSDYLEI